MRLGVGVVGTGLWATSSHLPALKALDDLFEIRAVCNRSVAKVEPYLRAAGLSADAVFVSGDWREVVARSDVDVLIVALPVEFNLEVARTAAEAGKHVIMEKPIAHDLADATKLVHLARQHRNRTVIMVAENYPYKEPLREMARLVMEGAIGSVVTFNLYFWRQFLPDANPYLLTTWRQNPKHIGGILSDAGVHWISMITTVLGPVASISANVRQIHAINGLADTISASLKLESGVVGNWAMTHASSRSDAQYQIVGTNGMLVLDNLMRLHHHKANGEVSETVFESAAGVKKDIVAEFRDFYNCVLRTRSPPTPDSAPDDDFVLVDHAPLVLVEDTYHHLAIVDAALASASSHRHEPIKKWNHQDHSPSH